MTLHFVYKKLLNSSVFVILYRLRRRRREFLQPSNRLGFSYEFDNSDCRRLLRGRLYLLPRKIFFLEIIGQTLKFACMKKIFLFLSLMPLLAACGHKDASMTEGFDCVVYEPVHASGFNIKKAEGESGRVRKRVAHCRKSVAGCFRCETELAHTPWRRGCA